MTDWQLIETAPKDGTLVLVHIAEPNDAAWLDSRTYAYPESYGVRTLVCRWCEADSARSDYRSGWYAPWATVEFGVYDDPSVDFEQVQIEPTHWMPLPEPPQDA